MRQIPVNGATLNVFERGAGATLVLLHGFPLNHTMWNAQFDALSVNHRLIVPDLRGFGGSTVTEGQVSMEQMADDVAALLDALALRQPVCICGLSMGGYVAFQFYRKYRSRMRSLILCDTRSAADSAEAAAARRQMADSVVAKGVESVAEAMLPKLLYPPTQTERYAVYQAVRQMIVSTDPRAIAATQRGMADRPDAGPLLPTIDVPTLVLVGEHDVISPPAEMRQIAAAIPKSQFVIIPGAGHMSPMEQPQRVNQELSTFLVDELVAR